jgi:hypothetical protein
VQPKLEAEKRKAARFEIDIPVVSYSNFPYIEFKSKIRDISSGGIGVIASDNIPAGSFIDVVLMVPHFQDRARLRAKVVWVQQTGRDCYRIGAELITCDFNPIPYVVTALYQRVVTRTSLYH